METVVISRKFRSGVLHAVRELLGVKPGWKIQVILYNNLIELLPVMPAKNTQGFLIGIDTTVQCEASRV